MRRIAAAMAALLWWAPVSAQPAPSFPVLDTAAVPGLDAEGRAQYARFLVSNLPRAFALSGGSGKSGWVGGAKTEAEARDGALASCARKGATDCALYAAGLDVVWQGRAPQVRPPPRALIETGNYAFVPDERFLWRGPAAARGVYVWSHGKSPGFGGDERGLQPQPHVRFFNNAGFDVVRFDRAPLADDRERAAGWLRDGLAALRKRGWRMVIAGGQSRGAWNSLQMLDTPGLADVVIAVSPAAHGSGASVNLGAQTDDFRAMLSGDPRSSARVAMVQFRNDLFMGDGDARAAMMERILRPKVAAMLLIDRPEGFSGHGAGAQFGFADSYGACLLRFATEPTPPARC
jgi:hypothetical protein